MLKTYIITRRLNEVAHVEGKTLNNMKRNENGAGEEDAAFEAKQNISLKLLKFGLDLILKENEYPHLMVSFTNN